MFWKTASRLAVAFATLILASCFLSSSPLKGEMPALSDGGPDWIHLSSESEDLPEPSGSKEQTASLILDINKDGVNDFVIGARKPPGPSLVWYQREPDGWTKRVIEDEVLYVEAGGAYHDIDGDGDLDIVMGGDATSNKVWWWENPYPNYAVDTPWVRREIKSSGGNQHHDQIFGDFDGDGTAELVFWNTGSKSLFLAEIPANPRETQPWSYSAIYQWRSGGAHEGLARADIDGDGKLDIVGGGRWFKHVDGDNYVAEIVDDGQRNSRAAVGQLKAGGRPEIVFVVGDGTGRLKWYEWTGSSWTGHDLLGFDVDHGHSLEVADVDGDGNLDIFVAEMGLGGNSDAMMLVFWGDGSGNFVETQVAAGYGNHESKIGDLDGDGDLDILGKPYNWDTPRVDIWLNDYSSGGLPLHRWERQVLDADRPGRAIFITSADIDGDGFEDVVTGAWWYQNPGDPSGSWTRNQIGSPLNNMVTVHDFDGDGDMDILGTEGKGANSNDTFVWARNDGSGQLTILNNVSNGDGDFLQGVAVDAFRNGQLGVALSWHQANKGIQLLTVSDDPVNQTWSWEQISPASQDEALSSGDIDDDGDVDLLLGTKWLRNDGDNWTIFDLYTPSGKPDRNRLADINSDGKLDAVVGYEAISIEGKLAWYEQAEIATDSWSEHIIANPPIVGPMSLDVADMDADGDLDVVAGEHNLANPSSAKLYVFENLEGTGLDWKLHLVHTGDEHHDGTQIVDIDNDGDLDIISIGWSHAQVVLYENRAEFEVPEDDGYQSSVPVSTRESPIRANDADKVNDSCIPDQALLALYNFDEGSGSVIHDGSGVAPLLDLSVNGSGVLWQPGGGLVVEEPTLIASAGPAVKVNESVRESSAFTVEVWVRSASLDQDGPARIVTLAADLQNRNFTLGQGLWGDRPSDVYDVRLRNSETNKNGRPSLTTPSGSASTELTHIVYVHQSDGESVVYKNSAAIASRQTDGDLTNWDGSYRLALANELGGERPWLGEFQKVAIYSCALSPVEIAEAYEAGPVRSTSTQTESAGEQEAEPPVIQAPSPANEGETELTIQPDDSEKQNPAVEAEPVSEETVTSDVVAKDSIAIKNLLLPSIVAIILIGLTLWYIMHRRRS